MSTFSLGMTESELFSLTKQTEQLSLLLSDLPAATDITAHKNMAAHLKALREEERISFECFCPFEEFLADAAAQLLIHSKGTYLPGSSLPLLLFIVVLEETVIQELWCHHYMKDTVWNPQVGAWKEEMAG